MKLTTREVIDTENNQHGYTTGEPVGICCQIIPWKYPLSVAAWKVGHAVATANPLEAVWVNTSDNSDIRAPLADSSNLESAANVGH